MNVLYSEIALGDSFYGLAFNKCTGKVSFEAGNYNTNGDFVLNINDELSVDDLKRLKKSANWAIRKMKVHNKKTENEQ